MWSSAMPSEIQIDPLLIALFDIPSNLKVTPKKPSKSSTRYDSTRRITIPRKRIPAIHVSKRSVVESPVAPRILVNETDTVGSGDSSPLQGESIPLSDNISDAMQIVPTPEKSSMEPPKAEPVSPSSPPFATLRTKPLMVAPLLRLDPDSEQDVTSQHLSLQDTDSFDTAEEDSQELTSKKKTKFMPSSSALKTFKKFVGRKTSSKPKWAVPSSLSVSSSLDDADSYSTSSTPTSQNTDVSPEGNCRHGQEASAHSDLGSILARNSSGNMSPEHLLALKNQIAGIRQTINSLECDLVTTRNELAAAHTNLQKVTMEMAQMQRASLEAEVALASMTGATTKDSNSVSSDQLNFLTPASSVAEESETRQRTESYDTLSTLGEKERSISDVDKTPVMKNNRRRDGLRISTASDHIYRNTQNELKHLDTPSTSASTREESESDDTASKLYISEIGNSFEEEDATCKLSNTDIPSFIRVHDLSLPDGLDLLPLHGKSPASIINALHVIGLQAATDESERWNPVRDTEKILNKRAKQTKTDPNQIMGLWPNPASGKDVLVWSSKCLHKGHGSDYPVVKARGLIPTSARNLVELLLDSTRVKSYNKMALGRTDEHSFTQRIDGLSGDVRGEAKIVRSKSQPPLVRKPLELRILLHAQQVPAHDVNSDAGPAYVTTSRSVWETPEGTPAAEDTSTTRCEMLLGANLIRELDGPAGKWCEITTITHAVSPGIPLAMGKRIGLVAAGNYIRDIRSVFEK